jgi:Uma2 family endonuclease
VEAADYSREHPSAAILVIEVATSSLRQDRRVKAALYARAKIPEFWLVDVKARSVEVYRDPLNTGFATVTTRAEDETLAPAAFPDVLLRIDAVLPTRR